MMTRSVGTLAPDGTPSSVLYDGLTGLANRALFLERLEHGLALAARHGWTLAVLLIDLDDFDAVNRAHGQAVGDRVLRIVANRLRQTARAEDTVGRPGGDEFMCVLLDVRDEADVAVIAEELADRVAEPCEVDDAVILVEASVGTAIYPADGETADELLRRADESMFAMKKHRGA